MRGAPIALQSKQGPPSDGDVQEPMSQDAGAASTWLLKIRGL
jgi:hypothetical protein